LELGIIVYINADLSYEENTEEQLQDEKALLNALHFTVNTVLYFSCIFIYAYVVVNFE
jgi:hypothetical protein